MQHSVGEEDYKFDSKLKQTQQLPPSLVNTSVLFSDLLSPLSPPTFPVLSLQFLQLMAFFFLLLVSLLSCRPLFLSHAPSPSYRRLLHQRTFFFEFHPSPPPFHPSPPPFHPSPSPFHPSPPPFHASPPHHHAFPSKKSTAVVVVCSVVVLILILAAVGTLYYRGCWNSAQQDVNAAEDPHEQEEIELEDVPAVEEEEEEE